MRGKRSSVVFVTLLTNSVLHSAHRQDCPNDNTMLSHQLNAFHGNITAENTIRDILP